MPYRRTQKSQTKAAEAVQVLDTHTRTTRAKAAEAAEANAAITTRGARKWKADDQVGNRNKKRKYKTNRLYFF
jgi:hypothetical protein